MRTTFVWLILGLTHAWSVRSAEVIPPVPLQYFNDYASVVSASTVTELNSKLAQFERDTSIQVVVAVYPKMQSDSSIEDYTVRVAQSWGVGQKDKDNGAVLFVFTQDRKMYLQVGYGLEGVLPDALAKRIIEQDIKPYFRQGDYDNGLRAGVAAILRVTQGEYEGTRKTVTKDTAVDTSPWAFGLIVFLVVFGLIIWWIVQGPRSGTVYSRKGRLGPTGTFWGSMGGWGGGSSSSGGGFSRGGGSFGGGGAGGGW